MSAVDRDLGPSSEIIFSIMEGSEESLRAAEYFNIEHTNGLLTLKKTVDHLRKSFNVTLCCVELSVFVIAKTNH